MILRSLSFILSLSYKLYGNANRKCGERMANNHKPSLFKLFVDAMAEMNLEKMVEETTHSHTHRFFEMLAENFEENECDPEI